MNNHTKAPWEVLPEYPYEGEYIAYIGEEAIATNPYRGSICRIQSSSHLSNGRSPEEAEANAHLIAAAPDLLAACEEFVRKCNNGQARSTKSYNEMTAAIAKAKGPIS